MIDGPELLSDLQPLRRQLEDDLRERSETVPELRDRLREEWQRAKARERTAQAYEAWREDYLAQAAVMWLLSCLFVRFLEDNELIAPPRLSGPGDRLRLARDQHTLYFQQHPLESDRDYLYSVFEAVATLPGAAPLFDRRHNPVWTMGISGDAATAVMAFWQRIHPATGALMHDFTDPEWGTRFLGDLYQDLSESARKKYALLQTPDFVLQFILDRTLTPAIDEFGYNEVRLIDPACGSGHFLLAAFERLFRLWSQKEPGRNARGLAQRALDQVSGVDLNPFAVAIARFRLLLAALRGSAIGRLADAPAFSVDLAAGDSLLHGPRPSFEGYRPAYLDSDADPIRHVYDTEGAEDLRRILGQRYHVVVGNPPYITPKDAALNKAYREVFGSCHMKYSLAVPFMERLFDLAIAPPNDETFPAGYVGMITANSFMKREFGSKLIEQFIPRWDLTHVIDTSGAYIPGHGTPTVILFGRNRRPEEEDTIRAVLGIRGEPSTPDDPARGLVWSAILDQVDRPGSAGDFVSVTDADRKAFERHPWSIGGGGAAELKMCIEDRAISRLSSHVDSIGFMAITGEDDAFVVPRQLGNVKQLPTRPFSVGDEVRDWAAVSPYQILFPYDDADPALKPLSESFNTDFERHLWPVRASLRARSMFGKSAEQHGFRWYEYLQFIRERVSAPLLIAFAEVATHNHFVLDRGGKVFKQTAPVIKLKPGDTEDDHLALLAILNSSTACFWMKQVLHDKGGGGIGGGLATEKWEHFFVHNASGLSDLPLPAQRLSGQCLDLARSLEQVATQMTEAVSEIAIGGPTSAIGLRDRQSDWNTLRERMFALQEELDWATYASFALSDRPIVTSSACLPSIRLGERAFEILMARRVAMGDLETTWFERHGSTPVAELPCHWPDEYKRVVERRIKEIESNSSIALIEQPEYKRRWNVEPWDAQVERAMRGWLLDRLELSDYWPSVELTSVARLADRARRDIEFMRVGALYRKQEAFDVSALVAELVENETVPFLPVLRYKPSGLRKREAWERTWDLQRREDATDARTRLPEGDPQRITEDEAKRLKAKEVGEIPVPPKYAAADFASTTFWRLRGKLDVPKERFISYPHCERDADPTLVIAWAGWDHLQQAQALATYYVQMKESEGWTAERLTPLLAGLLELLPWLKQWHNHLNPQYGQRMGEYFEGFVDEEVRALGLTREAVSIWTPPARTTRVRRPRR